MRPNEQGGRTLEGFEVRVALMAICSDSSLGVDQRERIAGLVIEDGADGKTTYELPLNKPDTTVVMRGIGRLAAYRSDTRDPANMANARIVQRTYRHSLPIRGLLTRIFS